MRNYFTIVIFIFLVNCSINESKQGITNINVLQNETDDFEEYVNLLLNKNKSKKYPDINNFPD